MAIPKQMYVLSLNGVSYFRSSNCKWLYLSLKNNQKELGIKKLCHYATCVKNVKKGKRVPFEMASGNIFYMHIEPVIQKILKAGSMKLDVLL